MLANARGAELVQTAAGRIVAVDCAAAFDVDRLRLALRVAPRARFTLSRVAILRGA